MPTNGQVGVQLAQVGDRRHGGGVAGQHHGLGALLAEEPAMCRQALADIVGDFSP
jgi:hypothetical protein